MKIVSKFEDEHIKSPQAIAGANLLANIMKNEGLSSDVMDRLFTDGSVAYILATSAANPENTELKDFIDTIKPHPFVMDYNKIASTHE